MFSCTFTPRSSRGATLRANATALPSQFTTVKPSGDRVLIKIGTPEAKTVGGILLPSVADSSKNEGEVVAVGEVRTCEVSSQVLYARYAGTAVKIGEDEHIVMKESDVIGVKGASMADMKPTEDRVLIKVAEADTKSAGGVLLTSQSAEKPTIGEVLAVGPGLPGPPGEDGKEGEVKPVNCSPGSQVLYAKYTGVELEEDDKQYVVVRESDILAVLS
eukprot:TRINITY_DN4678_c0_g4_i1.p1 TRINITY_DN4678_c0_g4~~TRINITY_DN4678_c0_g4_i1.p1  ORF type:complete len:243 (+),score=35.55 TRINITY_DN4678_c0_g4_i1:80-730(+)